MIFRKIAMVFLALTMSITVGAQDIDKIYEEAKALYDAKNYKAALPKLKAAAEKGHKKAQYRLGRCYDKGHGVTEDNKVAFTWYQKSAAQNYAKGQYALGKCYLKGKGTKADEPKAKLWITKAIKNPKGGLKLKEKIKKELKEGDKDAKLIQKLIKL
jgi:hypothetical protein